MTRNKRDRPAETLSGGFLDAGAIERHGSLGDAALDAAFAILREQPLPPDAEARLVKLEKKVGKEYRHYFGDVWEAFSAAGGVFTFKNR